MNSRIITEETDHQKQINFMKALEDEPRERAKNALTKQTDKAIEAIVEFKADLAVNGINACIYDFNYHDTDAFFKPLKEAIDCMDFIIGTETKRIDLLLFKEIGKENDKIQALKTEADKTFNDEVKQIRNENGTITFDY